MNDPAADKSFPVSWDQFHRDARALAWRLSGAYEFDGMVTVTRGGLVPAAIVCRELGIRTIDTISIASYDHGSTGEEEQVQGDVLVLKPVSDALLQTQGKGLLIIDDLVDTGKTAKVVRGMLPEAHFATVYAKPMGRPLVDTYVTEVSQDTWIYFPWDLGYSFQPPIGKGVPA